MRHSLYNVALAKATLAPAAARTATATGTAVDRMTDEGGFRSALVVVNVGTVTDGTHTVVVQDSDDGSSWAAVADEFLQGAEPAITSANDERVFEVGYVGHRRYLRAVVNVTGAPVTGGLYDAVILLGWPRRMPPARA
ncbi:hypothetical protein RI578_06465 [Streptomyces sp. BB1-1-1]|uniref:hypothetical protein n=1 Tax=Streptomyces sp. BB1-1-1 TaxID=3074430 RepID=UPI002877D219|nr:hypothetical protein [Streptomyces sp. BB1-1-1]WND33956.1 hypothetical protein RI578_06465 [Streptomyces sp. BB1-1-1]